MSTASEADPVDAVSVVVPAYNVARWLPHTLSTVVEAFDQAGISRYEIVVVNDGSTDDTAAVVEALGARNSRIICHSQENAGRLPAVQAGLDRAVHPRTLIINPRIEVFPRSFVALNDYLRAGNANEVWNGHVTIRYGWNLFARFWGVVTFVGWRAYLRRPRYVDFGLEEFDWYPKGTGFLLAPTTALRDAARTFDSLVDDPRFASDDTGVLRNLANEYRIAIAPEFGCWYEYGRSSIKDFVRHTFDRGTFFVDSYFRRGTRFFGPLLAFMVVSVALVVALALAPAPTGAVLVGAWLLGSVAALVLGAPWRNALAFAVVSPLFAAVFGLGLWRGFYLVGSSWLRRRRRA